MSVTSKIREHLPYRYSKTIQERIINKGGRKYALNYISMCLSEPPLRHNQDILNEAAQWAQELQAKKLETASIIESL